MRNLKEYCDNPPRYDWVYGILGFATMATLFILFMFGVI